MAGAALLAGASAPLIDPHAPLGAFIVFCRVGGCLMVAPGFSSTQIPVQVRLFIAVAMSLSLAPLVLDDKTLGLLATEPTGMLAQVAVEAAAGGLIGVLSRFFLLGLETLASSVATMLGFSNPFGLEVEANQSIAPFATMIAMGGTALIFAADLHLELLRGLLASYDAMPLASRFRPQFALRYATDTADLSFQIGLRICSPFFVYVVVVNLATALINRLTPQIAIYYIATPFVLAGGVFVLYFAAPSLLEEFRASYAAWLLRG